ncbi:MAG: hypothetical protein A2Z29_03235 [Chloroflexi bacterium RBG_16_56_11]|nr:MAG: hypothetical protein A2Z29_03235 [Chloroflexi bacterium RBG_16_56_11]
MIRLSKKRRRLFAGLLTATAIAFVLCLVSYFQLFHSLSQRSGDILFRGKAPDYLSETAGKIVVVAIDEASLEALGRFPDWPRSYHSEIINKLSGDGARIIVFDILFSEPSPYDDGLAAAMKKAGNVILPYAGTPEPGQPGGVKVLRPVSTLDASAIATGHANMTPDSDGVARSLPVIMPDNGQYQPSLALAAVAGYLRRPRIFDTPPDETHLSMAGREIPLHDSNMLINYAGDPSTSFKMVSYADVLTGNAAPGSFEDKLVVIGVTALGFGDVYWTPMGQALSGVEIHAQAMNTLLSGHFIRSSPFFFTGISIMLLALIGGLAALRFRVAWSAFSAVMLAAVYFLAAFYFFGQGLMLNLFYPPLSLAAVFLGVNLYNVTSERREKQEITRTFGKFVSPSVAAKILNTVDDSSLKLGGDEYPVTVLFADVRNFTGICENTSPQVLVGALNHYLSAIIEAILRSDGMINKFGGDSVMAVWNAPVDSPEHASAAVGAAVEAQREISRLYAAPNLPRMEFGIGVNSGNAIVGNMGSLDRLEYSVVGDTVNTAARLAALAPGGKIWIGAGAFAQVKDRFQAIPLGLLALKGKGEPVPAYEICLREEAGPGDLRQASVDSLRALVL